MEPRLNNRPHLHTVVVRCSLVVQYCIDRWYDTMSVKFIMSIYIGQVVSNLCPPGVGVWIGSVDYHKGSYSATDALDTLSLRKKIRIPYTRHVTNASVRETTGCPPVWSIIKTKPPLLWPCSMFRFLSVHRSGHQETGGDLEGARVPPGWGGLMPMYSRLTSISTQLGGRPTIVFSGDISSTQQHFH